MATTEKQTTRHTPGPWAYRPNVLAGDLGVFDIVRAAPGPLASVFVATLHNEADARLIAVAPEMVDMLDQAAQLFAYLAKTHGYETCAGMAQRIGGLLATIEDRA